MRVCIVVPTRNELENLRELLPKTVAPNHRVIVMDGLSKDGTAKYARDYGCTVPYVFKWNKPYGCALVEGLARAYYEHGCDYALQMDADHNWEDAQELLRKAQKMKADLTVGWEREAKRFRKVIRGGANFLARHFLGMKCVHHPTCGLRVWSKKALRILEWRKMRSKGFGVQIETLFHALTYDLKIVEVAFNSSQHRRMGLLRMVEWFRTWFRLLRLRVWMALKYPLVRGWKI